MHFGRNFFNCFVIFLEKNRNNYGKIVKSGGNFFLITFSHSAYPGAPFQGHRAGNFGFPFKGQHRSNFFENCNGTGVTLARSCQGHRFIFFNTNFSIIRHALELRLLYSLPVLGVLKYFNANFVSNLFGT